MAAAPDPALGSDYGEAALMQLLICVTAAAAMMMLERVAETAAAAGRAGSQAEGLTAAA